jgi:FkbM family methyltransferase
MLFPNFKPTGIVHLGAHQLQEMSIYRNARPKFIVWAEANPDLHRWIENVINNENRAWPPTKQYLCKKAITDLDHKEITFRVYNHTEASSIFPVGSELNIWYPEHKVSKEVKVMTLTVDTMLEEFNIEVDTVDYLSLDIQGAELLALKGAQRLLKSQSLKYIQTEAINNDYYEGGVRGDVLVEYLGKYGFEVINSERHTATYPGVATKIAKGELDPIDQLNLLFERTK